MRAVVPLAARAVVPREIAGASGTILAAPFRTAMERTATITEPRTIVTGAATITESRTVFTGTATHSVARTVLALVSDWLPATTGTVVYADGGASTQLL